MDDQTLVSAGLSTTMIAALAVAWKVFSLIRGRRFVSDCCGKMFEVGVDVRDMPHSPNSEENQNRSLGKPPTAESSESLPESRSRGTRHWGVKGTSQSDQRHQPSQTEEEVIVHVSSAPATVESIELVTKTSHPSDEGSSLPPTLAV